MLGEVAHPQVLGGLQAAGGRGDLPGAGPDQGGLAGAVGAQQGHAIAGVELQVHPLEHRRLPVAQAHALEPHQQVGQAVGLRKAEPKGRGAVGRGHLLHALQGLEPALGLAGLGGLGSEAIDEALDAGDLRLLLRVGGLALAALLGVLGLEGREAAVVQPQLAVLQMGHVVHHGVEEVPVVGDQQQGAGVGGQPLLQPQDGVQVQVVGGLVQQQEVGPGHQGAGQAEPDPPAPGEPGNRGLRIPRGEAQPVQESGRPGPGGIAVDSVEPGVQLPQAGAVAGGLGLRQAGLGRPELAVPVQYVLQSRLGEGGDLLGHPGQAPVPG